MADNFSNVGLFVPTTNIWDVSRLNEINVNSPEFKELLIRLYQNINNISIALNLKDSAYYDVQEFLNSQLYFKNPALDSTTDQAPTYRQVYRMVVNFGPLPNATTISIPHGIDMSVGPTPALTTYSFTRIYGAASTVDQTSFIPLPYASPTLNENISLSVTTTDIVITTAIDYSAYALTYVVVEYIKF